MEANLEFWHRRFVQQAEWTRDLRAHLLQEIHWSNGGSVLEVGCGTGAAMQAFNPTNVTGVDIALDRLLWASRNGLQSPLLAADGMHLPFQSGSFELVFCHFLLLWVSDPLQAVSEMQRVTRPSGWVMAFAEPDYGGRVDFPEELSTLGMAQMDSLRKQGAEPHFGRRLRAVFSEARLANITTGVIGGEWRQEVDPKDADIEHELLRVDLYESLSADKLDSLLDIDLKARRASTRTLFVPTFYAAGQAT